MPHILLFLVRQQTDELEIAQLEWPFRPPHEESNLREEPRHEVPQELHGIEEFVLLEFLPCEWNQDPKNHNH